VSDLSLVGLACGNDAQNVISWRVDHDEKTLFDLSQELIALFAVAAARVGLNQAIRIEKARAALAKSKPRSRKQASLLASPHSKFMGKA